MDLAERMARFHAIRAQYEGYTKRVFHLQRSGCETAEQYWEVWDMCYAKKKECAALDPADTSLDETMMASLEKDADRMRLAVEEFERLAHMRVQGHRMVLLKLMEESEDRPEFTADFVAELRAVLTEPWHMPIGWDKPIDWKEPGMGDFDSIAWKPAIDLDQPKPMDWSGLEDLLWRQRWYRSREKRRQQEAKDCLAELMTQLDVGAKTARPVKERPKPY
jgi:hypothetical protein